MPSDPHADVDEFRAEVERILEQYQGDPEVAHSNEDDLLVRALRAVVNNHPYSMDIAREALRLADAEVTRWYT